MFCAECGQRLAERTNYCPECGTSIASMLPPAAQPPWPVSQSAPDPSASPPLSATESAPWPGAGARPGYGFDAAPASGLARGMLNRVKNIVLSPSAEWPVIATEASSARAIYLGYVVPLVAVDVVADLLGCTLVGAPQPLLGTVRLSFAAGFAHAIVTFVLSLLGVSLIALIVEALAPAFGGQKDPLAALKVTAYSYTPAWVASILNLIPALLVLVVLAAFYGLYLLYLGLPVLMRAPKEKAVAYSVVTVLCAIVVGIVIASLGTLVVGALG